VSTQHTEQKILKSLRQLLTVICRFPLSFLNRPPIITSSSSFFHVITGFGAPNTSQTRTAVWVSAILVTDCNVLMKLGGSATQQIITGYVVNIMCEWISLSTICFFAIHRNHSTNMPNVLLTRNSHIHENFKKCHENWNNWNICGAVGHHDLRPSTIPEQQSDRVTEERNSWDLHVSQVAMMPLL